MTFARGCRFSGPDLAFTAAGLFLAGFFVVTFRGGVFFFSVIFARFTPFAFAGLRAGLGEETLDMVALTFDQQKTSPFEACDARTSG